MPKARLNPIVLIVINILAPSMYIFIDGSFLKTCLVAFAAVILVLMGCYKIFFITAMVYAIMEGIVLLSREIPVLKPFALFLVVLIQSVPCFGLIAALINDRGPRPAVLF